MRKRQAVGTKYDADLDSALDENQNDIVDTLLQPHDRLPEMKGAKHHIVSSVASYTPDAQPVQARGHIVWNRAYVFQSKGPSYLDGTNV